MSNVKVLVGADPELFMRNPNDGKFVSAHDRIPGTKLTPFKVPHGAIQVDGTALEFNIDPASTAEEFVANIKSVRKTLEGYVPGFNVVAEPVALYDKDYFAWDVPASAQELGCDPDYCGWTFDMNPRPDPDGKPMRTASGHVHIGWTEGKDPMAKEHFMFCGLVARQMDYYLGLASMLWDKDGTRRQLYGKAGAYRAKPYGMEYRVLSNRWLDSDAVMTWVYNSVQAGMREALNNNWAYIKHGDLARAVIDGNLTDWPDQFPELKQYMEKVPA